MSQDGLYGWANEMLFHVTTNAGTQATARMPAGDTGRWRHVVAVIDRQAGEAALYLDANGLSTA